MADDNVSFTDVGDKSLAKNGNQGSSSAMLDLLGTMKKGDKKNKKDKKDKKTEKKEKTKYKKERKVDKYESQNFLCRIEGSICCASLIIGIIMLITFIILAIVFVILTNAHLVHYISPWWGSTDDTKDGRN